MKRSSACGSMPSSSSSIIDLALVEDSHDDVLAVARRERRDAEVDRLAGDLERDAAVLRDAALGDVEVGEDLHARGDGRDGAAGDRSAASLEHAVDAVADAHVLVAAARSGCRTTPRSTASLITRCTSWMTEASSPAAPKLIGASARACRTAGRRAPAGCGGGRRRRRRRPRPRGRRGRAVAEVGVLEPLEQRTRCPRGEATAGRTS